MYYSNNCVMMFVLTLFIRHNSGTKNMSRVYLATTVFTSRNQAPIR